MRTPRDARRGIAAVIIGALALLGPRAEAQTAPVTMEWLSWSHFRFTSPGGKVILTNPFVTNPDSPIKVADIVKADVILVADGHGDELGSADEIAIKTGAKVLAPGELLRTYFEPRKVPEAQLLRLNPGDRQRLDGITVRGVNSVHGSGTPDKMYGGPALGFMIQFENGLMVYFAGSTAVTLDMQLWAARYKPDVAILPLSDRREVEDVVEMVRLLRTENPNLKTIIPHHHRLKPAPGAPTPADLESALKAAGFPVRLLNPELSRSYELRK
ncbi:MAG TPA: MBL fold metallo-hydrolase [Methylomirabilota bacterium]|jgi:L-ascorbate metabolism protein UlaG (beta-lactamase superfamily)|nr:MBL fold metallo-hydrolase [Methylomirabilota bacterium]